MVDIENRSLAFELVDGAAPCVIFCPGFNSTMQGNKARALKQYCQERGQSFIRFDYQGHGQSGGDFADGNISTWLADALSIIEVAAAKYGSVVLVGSSMGGWISLLASLQRPNHITGLLLIACAADMTKSYPARIAGLGLKRDDQGREYYQVANAYDDEQDYKIYKQLIYDGPTHFLLDDRIPISCPVRLIHGDQDEVVELSRSQRVLSKLSSTNASLITIEGGDHRLSTPSNLEQILSSLSELLTLASLSLQD